MKFLRKYLKPLSITLSVLFLGYTVHNNFEKLNQQTLNTETIVFLIASLFISTLSLVVNALAWKSLLIWLGYKSKNINITILFLKTNYAINL